MHFVGHRLLDNYLSNNYHTKTLYARGQVKTPRNSFFFISALLSAFPIKKKDRGFEYPAPELFKNAVSAKQ